MEDTPKPEKTEIKMKTNHKDVNFDVIFKIDA